MINTIASTIITTAIVSINSVVAALPNSTAKVLAKRELSLNNRYSVPSVNEIMKKNILLNLAYLNGDVRQKKDIDWTRVTSKFHFEKSLQPGEVFAYHENILSDYASKLAFTTNSQFNSSDGYLSDGYLFGDGVCHLASVINWVAIDAGLKTYVPKDHRSVARIPDIPDDYGVSIYMNQETGAGANNNLYITNIKNVPVVFHFDFDGEKLTVSIGQSA